MLVQIGLSQSLVRERESHQPERGFPGGSDGKESAGDSGSIPGSGRSPGRGQGNPLQYSCLKNPMDRGDWRALVHRVAKSRIQLIDFTFPFHFHIYYQGFPDSSVGKEYACNAGDPGSIPGSGRSPGEGIGYPLQYSWASLVAQLVKNPPVMRETWAQSLGWEDSLEKGKATHSSILAWRIPWTAGILCSIGLR